MDVAARRQVEAKEHILHQGEPGHVTACSDGVRRVAGDIRICGGASGPRSGPLGSDSTLGASSRAAGFSCDLRSTCRQAHGGVPGALLSLRLWAVSSVALSTELLSVLRVLVRLSLLQLRLRVSPLLLLVWLSIYLH